MPIQKQYPKIKLSEIFLVEWSKSQNTYHIDTAKRILDANLRARIRNRSVDWVTIGIVHSREEGGQLLELLEKKLPRD